MYVIGGEGARVLRKHHSEQFQRRVCNFWGVVVGGGGGADVSTNTTCIVSERDVCKKVGGGGGGGGTIGLNHLISLHRGVRSAHSGGNGWREGENYCAPVQQPSEDVRGIYKRTCIRGTSDVIIDVVTTVCLCLSLCLSFCLPVAVCLPMTCLCPCR